jgi:hypothetical protein
VAKCVTEWLVLQPGLAGREAFRVISCTGAVLLELDAAGCSNASFGILFTSRADRGYVIAWTVQTSLLSGAQDSHLRCFSVLKGQYIGRGYWSLQDLSAIVTRSSPTLAFASSSGNPRLGSVYSFVFMFQVSGCIKICCFRNLNHLARRNVWTFAEPRCGPMKEILKLVRATMTFKTFGGSCPLFVPASPSPSPSSPLRLPPIIAYKRPWRFSR